MKKTLLVTCQFPPEVGGVETHLYNIAKRLDPQKLVVLAEEGQFIPVKKVYRDKANRKFDKQQAYQTVRAPFYHQAKFVWPRWMPLIKKTEKIVQEKGIEQILAGQVLPIGTASMIVAKRAEIPYSVYTYAFDVEVAKQHWRRKKTLKKVLNNAEHIFTISDDTARRMTDIDIPTKKIIRVTPGLDIDEFLPDEAALSAKTTELKKRYDLEGKRIILTIGRLVARKGQDTVIKALPRILKKIPKAHYVIAGGGEYKKYLNLLVERLKLQQHVTFTGRFEDDEKAALYNLCDAFVMVSRIEQAVDIEGFGIVYLEANALKKPVVGANVGGVPNAVKDEYSGLLVDDPTDTNEVAKAISKLLLDEELARKLGEQGYERTRQQFNWDNLVGKLKTYL